MRWITACALALLCTGCGWTGFGFHADGPEMPRLREVLALKPGMAVADVGAGKGGLTRALAAEVGANGRVFATEVDPERLKKLPRLDNVVVVQSTARDTGLAPGCCDAIVLRRVYHHLSDPAAVNASLLRALRPGGTLAIIDMPAPFFSPRGALGVPAQDVIAEVKAGGFELARLIEDWPGRGPLASYCAVFRRP
jgi:SAM-dependent methyltransferase